MKQLFSFYTGFLITISSYAQYQVKKSINAAAIENIVITLHTAFQIEITTTPTDTIIIDAISDGEYQNRVLITTKQIDDTLIVQDNMQPFLEIHNDKLSAHKVIALRAKVQIPEHLNVEVTSDLASLNGSGKYNRLVAELSSGDCSLDPFTGNATIHTLTGDISLKTQNATVSTQNTSGTIVVEEITGKYQIKLKSISGDINVSKTK